MPVKKVKFGLIPKEIRGRLLSDPPRGPAVYFLFRGNSCVYIGGSLCHQKRILYHRSRGRIFDSVLYLPVKKRFLKTTENQMIRCVCPIHNHVGNPNSSKEYKKWGLWSIVGDADIAHNASITLRLKNHQREKIERAADKSRKRLTAWCRDALIQSAERVLSKGK